MKMTFKELFLFSPHEKKAKKIEFKNGINVITSNQEDGTDRGKSVVMRSLYHALGAESYFEAKWDTKSKIYILHICIDYKDYYIYRSADLYKFFDGKRNILFVSTHSHELAEQLKKYTRFAVMLPGRNSEKIEITPPVYNFLPFFLDQDHYDGSKYASFKNLQQYLNYKDSVLFYHLGIYDETYFELVREKEALTDQYNSHKKRFELLYAMQSDIETRIGAGAYSSDIDALRKDVELYRKDYADVFSKLNRCKAKLIELRNNLFEYETLLQEMSSLSSKNEKEISQLNEHICPECRSVLRETTSLRSKRYNLAEDIVIVKNELQVAIQNASDEIEKEESKYKRLLEQLAVYEEKLKINTKQANDVIRYKGLCEIREGIASERHDVLEDIDEEEKNLKKLAKEIKKYSEKKKRVEEKYYELLVTYRMKFGLNEIEPERFKKLTNNFTASGSNKNIATVIWYIAILNLRREFNPNAIEFPVVFDSPNNVETDNVKKHALLQYILDNASDSQLILSSIGFNASEFSGARSINVITLENAKYLLMDEEAYLENEQLLNELCDAEKS